MATTAPKITANSASGSREEMLNLSGGWGVVIGGVYWQLKYASRVACNLAAALECQPGLVEAVEDVGGGVEVEVVEVVAVLLEVVLVGVDAGGDAVVGCGLYVV